MLRVARQVPGRVKCLGCSRRIGRVQSCKLCTKPGEASEAPKVPPTVPPKKPRTLLKFLGGTLVVTGGALVGSFAYAKVDPEFRKQVESNWPFLNPLFEEFFDENGKSGNGEKMDLMQRIKGAFPSVPSFSVPSKSNIPFITDSPDEAVKTDTKSLLPKTPQSEKEPTPSKKGAVQKTAPVAEDKAKGAEAEKAKKQIEEREAIRQKEKEAKEREAKLIEQEIDEAADEAAMHAIIDSMLDSCVGVSHRAIDSQHYALDAIQIHSDQLKYAMDDSKAKTSEEKQMQWESVTGALDAKKDAIAVADLDLDTAKEEFEKLRKTLEEAKLQASKSKFTQSSLASVIIGAEETLNLVSYDLDTAVAEVTSAKAESKILSEYHDLVDKGKQQFKKELESIMPTVKLGKKGKKLTEDELNSLIAHAHRRVEQLQKQLAEQQAREQQRVGIALNKQKEEDRKESDARVNRELGRQKKEFSVLQQKMKTELQREYELEMRHQLMRQAAAHSDHINDVLRVQSKELEQQFDKKMEERVNDEREKYQVELHGALARLRGVESAIEDRADLEKQSENAQELWLACEALRRTVKYGEKGSDVLTPLDNEVAAIKEAGSSIPVVHGILEAIPEDALTRGVFTEESLIARWKHVKKVCKRVALVDEVGTSPFRYFLSYFQSFLIIDNPRPPLDEELDLTQLDTFKLLAFADYHIKHGDFDQAVRYVNQLQGMPRRVADTWLKEAILLLEVSQAANVLSATASASGLGALCI